MAATARMSESEQSQYVDRTLAWAHDRGIITLPIFAGVTGPLGGFVKCANAGSGDAAYTACIFADAPTSQQGR